MSTLHKVFVYGTLKQGQPNHYLLLEASGSGVARLLGEAELTERYPMIIHEDCGIPVLLDKSGDGKVNISSSFFVNCNSNFADSQRRVV